VSWAPAIEILQIEIPQSSVGPSRLRLAITITRDHFEQINYRNRPPRTYNHDALQTPLSRYETDRLGSRFLT
jgi:hypothetical protein